MIVRVLVEVLIFTFIISGIVYFFLLPLWKRNKQPNAEKIENATEVLENAEVERQEKEILAKAEKIKMEIKEPTIKVVEIPTVKVEELATKKVHKKSKKSTKK